MFKNFFLTFLALIAFWLYSTTNSFDTELVFLDDWKTIKENIEEIHTLDKENSELNSELSELNADYRLKAFLRKDLTLVELNKIRRIVSTYNTNRSRIELILFQKAKSLVPVLKERKLLLEEKRIFYSGLIPYINTKFKSDYLEYIKWDAKIFNKQKNITTDLIAKKEILNNKVEILETKIQKHKDFINETLKKIIQSKLDEKITQLNQNERFIALSSSSKIKVLNKTIAKINIKIEKLKKPNINTWSWKILEILNNSLLDKKIQTFWIAVEKLEEFRDSIK